MSQVLIGAAENILEVPLFAELGGYGPFRGRRNWGVRDDHAPPIYGNIEWNRVIPALAATGYDGPLTLETHCWYNVDDLSRSFMKHNYDSLLYLESLIGCVEK